MIWPVVMLLALAAFGVAVLAFRLPRITWTSLAAALVFGLAGYTLQASTGLPGAPRDGSSRTYTDEWQLIEARKLLVADGMRSHSNALVTSDAFARRGQFIEAAGFARNALAENANDFESWLALGNVLVEQAGGALTQASLYAYRQANALSPTHPAPAYFIGLSLIRQGRMMEALGAWRGALNGMDEADTPARAFMAERVGRLEAMLGEMGALPSAQTQPNTGSQGNPTGQAGEQP